MSKSLNNQIGINEAPGEIYGKVLSIPDALIFEYFLLTTDVPEGDLARIRRELESGETNPRDLKRQLARTIVSLYYSEEDAGKAESEFDSLFIRKEIPDDIPEIALRLDDGTIGILELLSETRMVGSRSEARRLIDQGGISVDGRKVSDPNEIVAPGGGIVLKIGKRRFLRVRSI
jgi:tyrosyl-tRNA synthetase